MSLFAKFTQWFFFLAAVAVSVQGQNLSGESPVPSRRGDIQNGGSILLGRWDATNSDGMGLTRLLIERRDNRYLIRAWGACAPNECDWGTTELIVLDDSPAVLANDPRPPILRPRSPYGFASWNDDSGRRHVTLEVENDVLQMRGYMVDKSYRLMQTFRREMESAPQGRREVNPNQTHSSSEWLLITWNCLLATLLFAGLFTWKIHRSRRIQFVAAGAVAASNRE